jgi:hypothetical protein
MALLTDGLCATLEDLAIYDSSVLSVASTEGIDVTGKLTVAHAVLSDELTVLLTGDRVDRVVVTGPLRTFYVYSVLEQVYRDAYNSQLNDRYEGRWRQYEGLRREAWRRLLEGGVGLVEDPVPKALPPILGVVAGTGPSATMFVRMGWLNSRGEAGAASECSSVIVNSGQVLTVQPAGVATASAAGWNVYIGEAPEETKQQNTEPIAVNSNWVQSAELRTEGKGPGTGQAASHLKAIPRVLRRG